MIDSEKVIIPKRYTSQFKQAKEILESENGGFGDDTAGLIFKLIKELGAAEASLATLVAQQEAMREALEMPIGHAEWWGDWPVSDLSPAHQAERIIKRRLAAQDAQEKGGKA